VPIERSAGDLLVSAEPECLNSNLFVIDTLVDSTLFIFRQKVINVNFSAQVRATIAFNLA